MKTQYFILLLIFIISACKSDYKEISNQSIKTGKDLIQRSIEYHDPNGKWIHFKSSIHIDASLWKSEETKEKITTELFFDNRNGVFKQYFLMNKIKLKGEVSNDTCYNQALTEIPEENATQYAKMLGCKGITLSKDYYSYLIGLPMKLLDAEAIVNDTIFERTYNEIKYDVVKVNYEPFDKNPSWYFYFNKNNHALELCKFTSREDENKGGEYIIYNQEKDIQGMKLRNQQVWLHNNSGLDTLAVENYQFNPS